MYVNIWKMPADTIGERDTLCFGRWPVLSDAPDRMPTQNIGTAMRELLLPIQVAGESRAPRREGCCETLDATCGREVQPRGLFVEFRLRSPNRMSRMAEFGTLGRAANCSMTRLNPRMEVHSIQIPRKGYDAEPATDTWNIFFRRP